MFRIRRLFQNRWNTCIHSRAMHRDHILYGDLISPPVRFVLVTASLLGTKLKFQIIDLFKNEHKTGSFKKINPQQKVPALVFGKERICDSHAIAMYLCKKTENQDLYPLDDVIMQARVDEMLFFNATTLFPVDSAIFTEYFANRRPVSEVNLAKWFKQLDFLEQRLSSSKWLSGDKISLSDLCCAITVSSLSILVSVPKTYENLNNWMQELDQLPAFEINRQGLSRLSFLVQSLNNINT